MLICGKPLDVDNVNFPLFRMEHQANLLWINSDSSYNIHELWLQEHFKKNERAQILIVQNENVLTPESIIKVSHNYKIIDYVYNDVVLFQMLEIYKKMESINSNGKTFSDICAQ